MTPSECPSTKVPGKVDSDLVIAPRGTDFQRRVWDALSKIPVGSTATYKEIAAKVGVGTAQEIGEACAANTVAVLIPCHRVVRSDGGLAGYRWGIHRKRAILEKEQETPIFRKIADLGPY